MDDLISRKSAIETLLDEGLITAAVYIERMPSAEPRKGKWERHYSRPNVYADLFWHCSECGYKNDENYAPVYHHFCPNCGARMEESDG